MKVKCIEVTPTQQQPNLYLVAQEAIEDFILDTPFIDIVSVSTAAFTNHYDAEKLVITIIYTIGGKING